MSYERSTVYKLRRRARARELYTLHINKTHVNLARGFKVALN